MLLTDFQVERVYNLFWKNRKGYISLQYTKLCKAIISSGRGSLKDGAGLSILFLHVGNMSNVCHLLHTNEDLKLLDKEEKKGPEQTGQSFVLLRGCTPQIPLHKRKKHNPFCKLSTFDLNLAWLMMIK